MVSDVFIQTAIGTKPLQAPSAHPKSDQESDQTSAWRATDPPGTPPPPGALEQWFASPQGAYVLAWETAQLDRIVADIFGYFAVQIGLPGVDFLRANRATSRFRAALYGECAVVADAHEMPFASESLDLLLLPHLLEFSDEPHQILREAERVLRPEGELIVTGFNPVSLWGVRKLFGRARRAPWNAEFVSVLRVKDWMKLLNFDMRGGRFGCYKPPFESEKWLTRFDFLDRVGEHWWPVAGAVYVMQAKKRVAGMRVITPAWRRQAKPAGALSPASSKLTHSTASGPGGASGDHQAMRDT
jgi:SAM-dependent methyltransferase